MSQQDKVPLLTKTGQRLFSRWPRSLLLLLTTIAIACAGCSSARQWWQNGFKVGPDFCGVPADTSADWIDSGDAHLLTGNTNYSHWWTVFNDPILDELIYTAYIQNLTLKKACQQIIEARAVRGVAVGYLGPQQQQMIGAYSRNEMSDEAYPFGAFEFRKQYDDWLHGFDAAWELDVWGKIRRGVEAADAGLNAQIDNYDDVLVMLQAEVAAAYIQMRTLEERIAFLKQNVDIQNQALDIIEKRFEGGVVSEIDVRQAKAIRLTTESFIPSLEENHRRVQNAICILLGMPPYNIHEDLGGAQPIPTAPKDVVLGLPAELLRRRPDVRRAEFMAAAQSARIGVAEAELYPQFALTGTIALQAEQLSDLYGWDAITGAVGPGFRWNILNYGRIQNGIVAQDARFKQAILDYQNTVLMANKEVEDAIVGFLREQERADILKQAVAELEASLRIGLLLYEQGVVDYQRVLDSQRALVLQQDSLAESRGKIALNLVAVYKAIGGGWEARMTSMMTALPEGETAPIADIPTVMTEIPPQQEPANADATEENATDADATGASEVGNGRSANKNEPPTDNTVETPTSPVALPPTIPPAEPEKKDKP